VVREPSLPPVEIEPTATEKIRNAASAIAALLAVVLIIAGILVLASALFSAWSLYRDPAGIEPYVRYFVQLVPALEDGSPTLKGVGTLVAWLFAVLMLLVLGKLGSWAIGSASRLIGPVTRRRD
jgi:hypothetical protein